MNNARLVAYSGLERIASALDVARDPLADEIRDLLDSIWYSMTDEEHRLLDARLIVDESTAGIVLPIGDKLFVEPPAPTPLTERSEPIAVTGWVLPE